MDKSIFNYSIKPIYQGLFVGALFFLALAMLKVMEWFSSEIYLINYCWLFGTALLLFFILINSVFSFTTQDKLHYFRNSIYTYLACLVLFVALNSSISGKSVFEVDTYSWIITVFSIVYIVFITIINLVRKIVEIAINQNKKIEDES